MIKHKFKRVPLILAIVLFAIFVAGAVLSGVFFALKNSKSEFTADISLYEGNIGQMYEYEGISCLGTQDGTVVAFGADGQKMWEQTAEQLGDRSAVRVITAYGTVARICKSAAKTLRKQGIKAGVIRPITLYPFPSEAYEEAANGAKAFLTVELSLGQMVEDVRLSVNGKKPVYFYGRTGGNVMDEEEIVQAAKDALAKAELAKEV